MINRQHLRCLFRSPVTSVARFVQLGAQWATFYAHLLTEMKSAIANIAMRTACIEPLILLTLPTQTGKTKTQNFFTE